MYCLASLLVSTLLFSGLLCNNAQRRDPRFLRGTHTTTVTEVKTHTSFVPSSCVYVEPTLPPCRSVRFLGFPQLVGDVQQGNESSIEKKSDPTVRTTDLSWGEYFGVFAPTVTVTQTEYKTDIVRNPAVVVTFAVKNCRPLRIPMNLDRCPMETDSVLPIHEVLPTSTVVGQIQPSARAEMPENTKVVNIADSSAFAVETIDEVVGNSQDLEGTREGSEDIETGRATDPLSL